MSMKRRHLVAAALGASIALGSLPALAAPGERILEVKPSEVHQRTTVILGSADEVDHVVQHL